MRTTVAFLLALLACSCAVRKPVTSARKIAPETMQADYALFRAILEEDHPGLYWYTPKDSMDLAFDQGRARLDDSLTEPAFRNVLSYVLSKIRCGHTTTMPSRSWLRSRDTLRNHFFPLVLKLWPDTAIVTQYLSRKDSVVPRGAILTSIDGRPMNAIVDSLFQFLSTDGYNRTHKYQTLTNRGAFGSLYLSVFGAREKFSVGFLDSNGIARSALIPLYTVVRDTTRRPVPQPTVSRRERRSRTLTANRSLRIDTATGTAFMELNTFTRTGRLRSFFRKTFRTLRHDKVPNLVIDLRSNGGGSVTNSNLLTKYIAGGRFRIADSLFANNRHSSYSRYQQSALWNRLFLLFFTHRRSDGRYHFTWFENRSFRPKKKNHYDGNVYVLNGGNTFSASTLFAGAVRPQPNVTLVGEETGGGAYGNNAWLIPDVTLPRTGVRFRLPLFRLVIDKNAPRGFGVQPEIFAGPTVDAIRHNRDYKTDKVMELIRKQADVCGPATVHWAGDPKVDGLGWTIVIGTETFIVRDALPQAFRVDGMQVNACLFRTGEKIACKCMTMPDAYGVRSISVR
ncbi:MAG: hypothetical protein JWP27_794 [Flaviaesturariibacter sp.]|nr:hypothetical protein [Flaviaesturariibacter sp.]